MSLNIINVTPNIQNIIIDQLDDQYKFTTTVKFLARNMSKVRKDYFILYCMDSGLFAELVGSPGSISSYISKAKSDKNLVISQNQFQYCCYGQANNFKKNSKLFGHKQRHS